MPSPPRAHFGSENESLKGLMFIKFMNFTGWCNFLEKQSPQDDTHCQQEPVTVYDLSLGRQLEDDCLECCLLIQAVGTGSDCASNHFAYNLCNLPPYTLIWHYTIVRHTRVHGNRHQSAKNKRFHQLRSSFIIAKRLSNVTRGRIMVTHAVRRLC